MTVIRRTWPAAVAALTVAGSLSPTSVRADDPVVAITTIVEHATLDAVRDGIRDALGAAGYADGHNLTVMYETAEADADRASEIAQRFAATRPDVVVAVSAPTAEIVVKSVTDSPVVITAVSPARADEILGGFRRRRNVAALVQAPPLSDQLGIIADIAPATTTVLVPFNQRAANSRAIIKRLRQADDIHRFAIRPVPVVSVATVVSRLRAALPQTPPDAADDELAAPPVAIYLPDDPSLAVPIEDVATLAGEARVLLVAGNADAVARGATATVTYDPYDIGWQTGETVARILTGVRPREIAIRAATATHLVLNKEAAEKSGITLAPTLLNRADVVYE